MVNKIQFIKERCISANPDLGQAINVSPSIIPPRRYKDKSRRSIRLADILIAVYFHERKMRIGITGSMWKWNDSNGFIHLADVNWNLFDDNLENQGNDTINFLYELLL